MRRIVLSIQNGLLGEALTDKLVQSGEFQPVPVAVDSRSRTVAACVACSAEILLMEVSLALGATLEARFQEIAEVRRRLPNCKIVLLCDELVSPQIAKEVTQAKKSGRIDAFFYTSVTVKYLAAALFAL
jgi:hypothetical protein